MLHAILLNKAGRSLSSGEIYWKQLFTASEDSLTSTIFGSLLHLSPENFWSVLNKSCYLTTLTENYPRILSVEFWPHWDSKNSSNVNFIEPDIFIRTSEFDLIVEAKRFDDKQQSRYQWINECQGYINEYAEQNKKLIFLAVGGISGENPEEIVLENRTIRIVKCRWIRILSEVKSRLKLLKRIDTSYNNDSSLTILNDIILGFGIHGYSTGDWLENDNLEEYSIAYNSDLITKLYFI